MTRLGSIAALLAMAAIGNVHAPPQRDVLPLAAAEPPAPPRGERQSRGPSTRRKRNRKRRGWR